MFNIADYFKKFAKIEGDSKLQNDAVNKALVEICGLEGVKFEIKKGTIYIAGSSVMRSLVYTKKAAVLAAIRESLPRANIIDIR